MIGKKIGKWSVLEEVKVEQKRSAVFRHYKCACDCGVIKIVRADGLRNGRSSQCSDCRKKEMFIDTDSMIGKKFDEWLVIEALTDKRRIRKVRCICKCGTERVISASVLKLKKNKQCHLCNVTKHGFEGSKTYNTWRCMTARCKSEKNDNYKSYGGRGIKVCDRWSKFEHFLEDMGERPEGLQLDRIDNNGNYEPGNCRWTTPKENSNNRRSKNRQEQKPLPGTRKK
jgi:hypothetical protein